MKIGQRLGFTLMAVPLFLASPARSAASVRPDWERVRSVSNPYGGVLMYYVLIPEQKQKDMGYYRRVAARICGSSKTAMVFFWSDRAHVPKSAEMPVRELRVMTATYERNPSYQEPKLHLAAWLYPTPEAAKRAHCFYAP